MNMTTWKKVRSAAMIAAVLAVTGCTSAQTSQTLKPESQDKLAAADSGTAAEAKSKENVNKAEAQPVTAAAGNQIAPPASAPAAPQAEPAQKTYKMNPKTYDIVPIDPEKNPKQVVLLTFDDGPKDLALNQKLLDTLDKHKAKAIFFLNGYRIKQKPEIVKLLDERGQTIGNHSWDHIDLKKESPEKVADQIGSVQRIVKEITGKAPAFFRPPFGSGGEVVRAKAEEEKLLFMTWSNGSKDWEMSSQHHSTDQLVQNVLDQLHNGSNILMHELPWTAEALDTLLTRLEERGYGFVDPGAIDITLH